MKRTLARIFVLLLTVSVLVSTVCATSEAAAYTASILQGNTNDEGDCAAFFEGLKSVPSGNTYTINNYGWQYNNGNSKLLDDRATAEQLVDAGRLTVMYWSGHGSSNPLRLNVKPSVSANASGNYSVINLASTLGVDGSNWKTECVWDSDSNLKVAIFGACKILDNTYGDCKYLVRTMKASNIRVIAGYHETSPTNPTDTTIAKNFFDNDVNGGVSGGESVRSSWQTANELSSQNSVWAVLCYKDNYNQYYRIPGFPGNTYTAPSSTASVYRFWNSYSSATGGQEMTTSLLEPQELPLELSVGENVNVNMSVLGATNSLRNNDGLCVIRELDDTEITEVNESVQKRFADNFIQAAFNNGEIFNNAIKTIGTVTCEEMDPDLGVVPDSAVEVGKTFCYNNQYNGVKLLNNFYKIATDSDGIYFVINNWKDVSSFGAETYSVSEDVSLADAFGVICEETNKNIVTGGNLTYVPVDDNTYRLAFEIFDADGFVYYVDCETGENIQVYYAN